MYEYSYAWIVWRVPDNFLHDFGAPVLPLERRLRVDRGEELGARVCERFYGLGDFLNPKA
jgi:hypothetical protein